MFFYGRRGTNSMGLNLNVQSTAEGEGQDARSNLLKSCIRLPPGCSEANSGVCINVRGFHCIPSGLRSLQIVGWALPTIIIGLFL